MAAEGPRDDDDDDDAAKLRRSGTQPLLQPLTRTWSEQQQLRAAARARDGSPSSRGRGRGRGGGGLRAAVGLYVSGLLAAVGCSSLDSLLALLAFFRLQRVRTRVWQCVLLNGLLFLGSLLWFHAVVAPCVLRLLRYFGTDALVGAPFFESVYNLLWVYPMYIMTLAYVSPRFFDDIASVAFEYTQSQLSGRAEPRAAERAAAEPASDFWGSLDETLDETVGHVSGQAMLNSLIVVFYLQTICLTQSSVFSLPALLLNLTGLEAVSPAVASMVHVAARVLLFLLYTWLYSLYCFNYKWSLLRWAVKKQITAIEAHWAFFAGFGTPAAAISVLLSPCVGLGCYSTCFPLLLLAAEVATQPDGHIGTRVTVSVTRANAESGVRDGALGNAGLPVLPVFRLAEHLNGLLVARPFRTILKVVAALSLVLLVNVYIA